MFREADKKSPWTWLLLTFLAAPGLAATKKGGFGLSPRSHDAVNGRMIAPNLDDHANYFSESRQGVPQENLDKADALRLKTISSIAELLKTPQNSARRFELLLRQGELHVERHDYLHDLEMAQYEKSWDQWNKTKKGPEPKLETSRSNAEMMTAAGVFRQLVQEFPRHPRTDAALYSLARVLARMGKDSAVEYYKQLVKSFPSSPLLPDTYLSLGEYYFDKHDIPSAIGYYRKVMDFKEHRAYPYAVYKLGWAFYNSPAKNDQEAKDAYGKAVAAFKLVIKLADQDKASGKPKSNLDLREEAIKDLIMVWAEGEDIDTAWNYFRSIGEEDAFYKMLERLGNIYADQGKHSQATVVFQRLLKEAPLRETNPAVHAKLLELHDLSNNTPQVVQELKRMHGAYLGSSSWTEANKAKPEVKAEAQRVVELYTHRYGAMFHQRGQKAKSDLYLKFAAEVYTLYLGPFAANPNAYDIRYYLAEILFDFKQFEAAADHYSIVAKADPKGKYAKPSALNAVAAMNQLVQSPKGPALPPAGQVPTPLKIPRYKERFVEVIDQYVALLPHEKDGEPMRFTAAQIQFEYGHYPEALGRFEKIIQEIPGTKQARAAARVILGFYADKEDWNKVISWGQAFAKNAKLLDPELKKYVVDLQRSATFKRALAYEKAQQYDRAAASFLEYQKEFSSDQSADRALFNAALNYEKVGKIESSLATMQLLLDKYPKSELKTEVLVKSASTYEGLAKFEDAAQRYEQLALSFPADQRSAMALFNAAVLYKGLRKYDKSVAVFSEFGRRFKGHELEGQAALEKAQLLERTGKLAAAAGAYDACQKAFAKDPEQVLAVLAKAAVLRLKVGDTNAGQKQFEKVKSALLAKGAEPAYEARSTVGAQVFMANEALFKEFMASPVNDGASIEKQVAQKQAKLEKLASGYEQVMALGAAEYTVASLYRLGEAHENFAQALFKAPAPQGASPSDVEKLQSELEKVAFPLKEEAYKFFETAFKRSKEVETFSEWTRRTYQKMVELAPDKHPEVNEVSAEPTYLSHELKMNKDLAALVGAAE